MLHVLGCIKLSPTIDLWKVGLVLRPVLLKEKCLDISNSTETQGVHLVDQGGAGWNNEPRGLSTWYVWLACNNINILMHVRILNQDQPITKQIEPLHWPLRPYLFSWGLSYYGGEVKPCLFSTVYSLSLFFHFYHRWAKKRKTPINLVPRYVF